MKTIARLAGFVFLLVALSSAAEPVDVAYLKDGSIIKGALIELEPDGELSIRSLDDVVLRYAMQEVARIRKEEVSIESAEWAESEGFSVVSLKDGSVVQGMIVEQLPGKSLSVETPYGCLFVIAIDNVA